MLQRRWFLSALLLGLIFPLSGAAAESMVSPHFYAWGNNIGYINFRQVTVTDEALSGFAWSSNAGWINMSPAMGGVTNDGTGNLDGSAWGANLGWIDFDGVTIDGDTGEFSGTATGVLAGTISFSCNNCRVVTDWRADSSDDDDDDDQSSSGQRKTSVPTTNQPGSDENTSLSEPSTTESNWKANTQDDSYEPSSLIRSHSFWYIFNDWFLIPLLLLLILHIWWLYLRIRRGRV